LNTQDIILKTLTDSESPLKAGEIAELSGIDKKDVDKAIKILKDEEKIISPKKCYYSANR